MIVIFFFNNINKNIHLDNPIDVKPKPKCQYTNNTSVRHKMIHTLLLCFESQWHELKFVKRRTPEQQIEHYSQCED